MEGNVMEQNVIFKIHVFGQTIPITSTIITMWIVMAVMLLLAYIFTRKLKTIPEGKQNVAELIVETINNTAKENIGHHWRDFAPYFGSIFIFLVAANMSPLFSIIPKGEQLYHITGLKFFEHWPNYSIIAPTTDLNVTATMGAMSILLVLFSSIRYKGVGGWLKGFAKPNPVMIPFNIMDYGTRFLSLSLRLFGNLLASFIVMELVISHVQPLILAPVAGFFFDMFDACLQAFIFVFLSAFYIREAIE